MKNVDGPAVRLVDSTDERLAEFVPDELAVTLGAIAEVFREGLMAVAIEAGLATAVAIMNEEVDALCGAWNARDPECDHERGGTAPTSVVMGGHVCRSADRECTQSPTANAPASWLCRRVACSPRETC